jgi:hypothetical protein
MGSIRKNKLGSIGIPNFKKIKPWDLVEKISRVA